MSQIWQNSQGPTFIWNWSFLGHKKALIILKSRFAFKLTVRGRTILVFADEKKKNSCFDLVNRLQLFLLAAEAFWKPQTFLWLLHQWPSWVATTASKTWSVEPAAVCGSVPQLHHWHRGWGNQGACPARGKCQQHEFSSSLACKKNNKKKIKSKTKHVSPIR